MAICNNTKYTLREEGLEEIEMDTDIETISAAQLKIYIDELLESNLQAGIEVDLMANYLLTLKDSTDPTKKALCEALYYIISSGYEIRLFLESLRKASELGKYTNLYKYLAVQLYENTDTTPMIVNKIWTGPSSSNLVDTQKIKSARKRFVKDLAGQIGLLKLDDELDKIRNHAGAHHLDGQNKIDYLLYVNSLNRGAWGHGGEFYNNAIVALGLHACIILNNLSNDLRAADKSGTVDALYEYVAFMQHNEDYFAERIEINPRFKIEDPLAGA